jgi:hypothetical protein
MPNPTPGQIAYAAYCSVTYGADAHPADYATLTWGQRDAWEAAAQAVLAMQQEEKR